MTTKILIASISRVIRMIWIPRAKLPKQNRLETIWWEQVGIRPIVKGQPKWCEKGKLTFPDVPSTIMNQTGPGICNHIKDSGACFYVRNRASNSNEKWWVAPILQRILLRITLRYRHLKPMPIPAEAYRSNICYRIIIRCCYSKQCYIAID